MTAETSKTLEYSTPDPTRVGRSVAKVLCAICLVWGVLGTLVVAIDFATYIGLERHEQPSDRFSPSLDVEIDDVQSAWYSVRDATVGPPIRSRESSESHSHADEWPGTMEVLKSLAKLTLPLWLLFSPLVISRARWHRVIGRTALIAAAGQLVWVAFEQWCYDTGVWQLSANGVCFFGGPSDDGGFTNAARLLSVYGAMTLPICIAAILPMRFAGALRAAGSLALLCFSWTAFATAETLTGQFYGHLESLFDADYPTPMRPILGWLTTGDGANASAAGFAIVRVAGAGAAVAAALLWVRGALGRRLAWLSIAPLACLALFELVTALLHSPLVYGLMENPGWRVRLLECAYVLQAWVDSAPTLGLIVLACAMTRIGRASAAERLIGTVSSLDPAAPSRR